MHIHADFGVKWKFQKQKLSTSEELEISWLRLNVFPQVEMQLFLTPVQCKTAQHNMHYTYINMLTLLLNKGWLTRL